MRKSTVLMLVTCLVVSSLMVLIVTPANVYGASELSVPQISSVKFFDISYDVPPSTTTTVNEYTGEKTTITDPGYRVTRYSIEVTIKNQPFTPYIDEFGCEVKRDYVTEFKGPFGEEWKSFGYMYLWNSSSSQPNSGHTVVTYEVGMLWSADTKVDFRVRAGLCINTGLQDNWTWEWSDWSKVKTVTVPALLPSQTVTLPQPSNSDNQSQYPDQTQPPNGLFTNPLFTLVVGVILGGIVVAVVMAFLRRHIKTPTYTNGSTQTNTLEVRCRYA